MEKNIAMTNFETDIKVSYIVEQYKSKKIEEELARRELRMLGLEHQQIEMALGKVQLNG